MSLGRYRRTSRRTRENKSTGGFSDSPRVVVKREIKSDDESEGDFPECPEPRDRVRTRRLKEAWVDEEVDTLRRRMKFGPKAVKSILEDLRAEQASTGDGDHSDKVDEKKKWETPPYDDSESEKNTRSSHSKRRNRRAPNKPYEEMTEEEIKAWRAKKSKPAKQYKCKPVFKPITAVQVNYKDRLYAVGDIVSAFKNRNYYFQIVGFLEDQFEGLFISAYWIIPGVPNLSVALQQGCSNPNLFIRGPLYDGTIDMNDIEYVTRLPVSFYDQNMRIRMNPFEVKRPPPMIIRDGISYEFPQQHDEYKSAYNLDYYFS